MAPRARYRDAHVGALLRDHHAHDGVLRRGVSELAVSRLLGNREAHTGDQLAAFQCRLEHTLEVVAGWDLALVGLDGCAEAEQRGWVISRRVAVRDRTAERASVSDLWVPDSAGQIGKRGNRL